MTHPNRIWWRDVQRTYAYTSGGRAKRVLACLRSPGVHAVSVLRFGQWSRRLPWPLRLLFDPLYFIGNVLLKILWGIEIPRSVTIGPGLYIGHFGGITVSASAVLGANCNLSQGITIGLSGQGDRAGVPVIGDNVYIAPGARLFGKIRIGHHVKIGANVVVHEDIPDNAIVALVPGYQIVSLKGNRGPQATGMSSVETASTRATGQHDTADQEATTR